MSNALKFAAGGVAKLYAEDVFSAYTYTGTGAALTITNGIDLAGKGGMVWVKSRSVAGTSHYIQDTTLGANNITVPNTTAALSTVASINWVFNANGFTQNNTYQGFNNTGDTYVSWTFRKAPKFFDVVTYTGNGANRTIAHSLGGVPGMIVVKRTDLASEWKVYHTSITNTEFLALNTTAAKATDATLWNSTTATSSVFSIGTHADVNTNAATYVAYVFAHDTTADGLIQCGSFTADAGGAATVTLGWEPQFLLSKRTNSATDWHINDTARGFTVSANPQNLYPNLTNAEVAGYPYRINATGFTLTGVAAGDVFIYLAIRRPNKPPTVGTQVYNAIARMGTSAVATVTGVGFAPDMVTSAYKPGGNQRTFFDRLRGANLTLLSTGTAAEDASKIDQLTGFDVMDGIRVGADAWYGSININSGTGHITHFFKRAPGVFDEVCDTGTGVAKTESHSLGAVPELMIRKGRSGVTQWEVYHSGIANTEKLVLNTTAAKATDTTAWNSTTPTSTVFTVGTGANVNTNAATYVTYLMATVAGISKCGSYTGNGSALTVACGFTTGARFVLIKRVDAVGDFFVFDSVRGIVAATDPRLSLNTTAAEVTTDDSIDPDVSGFIVNQLAATDINVNAASYVFWAVA